MSSALATTVIKEFVLPWILKPKKAQRQKPPHVHGVVNEVLYEAIENHEVDPKRAIISAVIGGMMMFAVQSGYITVGESECLSGIIEDRVIEAVE